MAPNRRDAPDSCDSSQPLTAWDLVLCNPPYIPRPRSIDDNPYEGIGLLTYLLTGGPDHLRPGGRVVTNVSSLCERQAQAALTQAGRSAMELDSLRVPLKVFNVLNNREWMDYLHATAGLVAERRAGYDFWHTITIVQVTAPGS